MGKFHFKNFDTDLKYLLLSLNLILYLFITPFILGKNTASYSAVIICNLIISVLSVYPLLRKRAKNEERKTSIKISKPLVIQVLVQLSILAYWIPHYYGIRNFFPLIFYQIFLIFCFQILLSFYCKKSQNLSISLISTALSINFFLIFTQSNFYWALLTLFVAVFCRTFLTRQELGNTKPIFNPSAFAMTIILLILMAFEINIFSDTFNFALSWNFIPYCYQFITVVGLISLYHSKTYWITISALTYVFISDFVTFSSFQAAIVPSVLAKNAYLSFFLLITDPTTTPRSKKGQIAFGVLYGIGYQISYIVLSAFDLPVLYDKLMPVCIMNFSTKYLNLAIKNIKIEKILNNRIFAILTLSTLSVLLIPYFEYHYERKHLWPWPNYQPHKNEIKIDRMTFGKYLLYIKTKCENNRMEPRFCKLLIR